MLLVQNMIFCVPKDIVGPVYFKAKRSNVTLVNYF